MKMIASGGSGRTYPRTTFERFATVARPIRGKPRICGYTGITFLRAIAHCPVTPW
jgi:hypothetical protein